MKSIDVLNAEESARNWQNATPRQEESNQVTPRAQNGAQVERRTVPLAALKSDPFATRQTEMGEIPPPPPPPPIVRPPVVNDPYATRTGVQVAALPAPPVMETPHNLNQATIRTLPQPAPSAAPSAGLDAAGKYEYLTEIGSGRTGYVVAVRDRSLRRRVAMKLLGSGSDGKQTRRTAERFLAEAQITGQLEHPNIVPIHDFGVLPDGRHFCTMKLVRGETLRQVFERSNGGTPAEKYTLPRLLAVLQQIANALSFAHARGVIHRNLKPENIMLGEFGEVLLMDWGLAKLKRAPATFPLLDEDAAWGQRLGIDSLDVEGTRVGTVAGTPGYLAPEQARGEVDKIDERTDVFALGAVLYELLTGTPPYHQADAARRIQAAADGRVIDAPAVRSRQTNARRGQSAQRVPRELAAIAMKALAHKAEDRYASAQEFGEEVQRYLECRPVVACPDTLVQRAARWLCRNLRLPTK